MRAYDRRQILFFLYFDVFRIDVILNLEFYRCYFEIYCTHFLYKLLLLKNNELQMPRKNQNSEFQNIKHSKSSNDGHVRAAEFSRNTDVFLLTDIAGHEI